MKVTVDNKWVSVNISFTQKKELSLLLKFLGYLNIRKIQEIMVGYGIAYDDCVDTSDILDELEKQLNRIADEVGL